MLKGLGLLEELGWQFLELVVHLLYRKVIEVSFYRFRIQLDFADDEVSAVIVEVWWTQLVSLKLEIPHAGHVKWCKLRLEELDCIHEIPVADDSSKPGHISGWPNEPLNG